MYDSKSVIKAMALIGKSYGYDCNKTGIFCCKPTSVGKAVILALTAEAHLLSIDMVAKGQWPHYGS
jgi:hypothetical protein